MDSTSLAQADGATSTTDATPCDCAEWRQARDEQRRRARLAALVPVSQPPHDAGCSMLTGEGACDCFYEFGGGCFI